MAWDTEQRVKALIFLRRREINISFASQFLDGMSNVEDKWQTSLARVVASLVIIDTALADPDITPGETTALNMARADLIITRDLLLTLPPP